MANSRKSNRNSFDGLEAAVAAALRPLLFPGARLVLGLSGGLDSVVLLHALGRLAQPLGFRLACVHVNHRISPNAASWAAFCTRLCRRRKIPIEVREVDIGPYRSEGLEAAARRARYGVYACQADADFIVLAQHQDDQAETLLLQLLRGAGVKGAAAMPLVRAQDRAGTRGRHGTLNIVRPMLALARTQILAYARSSRLKWMEDESNADTRYDRNFLRHRVLPVIERSFPAYRATLARAARHLAEADQLLDQLAQFDARRVVRGNRLELARLRNLGMARSKNLLRWLLQRRGAATPESERLHEGLRQLLEAREDAGVRVVLGAHELRRHAGSAYLLPALPDPPAGLRRSWDGGRECSLPELGGTLLFSRSLGSGLARTLVRGRDLNLRLRIGGEKLRLRAKGATRSLKNLLQEAGLPPWERERLPLVYCGDTLVAVPGLGVANGWEAGEAEPGWAITWRPQY